MKNTAINEQVSVTQLGFKKDLAAYPRRIEFRGTVYEFVDSGLRCLVRRGNSLVEIISLSDGLNIFRLKHDRHSGSWTLLSIGS